MRIFDTHAHYDDEKFDGERGNIITEVLNSGVERILNASSDLKSSAASIALAEKYPQFYAAVGIHPHECEELEDEKPVIEQLEEMLSNPKVRAIGEIGLDYHYDLDFKEKQLHWFDIQLSLAEWTGYPVIVHDREAHGDTMELIRSHPKCGGILHAFSGSAEMAKELVKLGWYIAFGGSVTFKGASKPIEALKAVPDDRLLVETDCPYLAPVPMRGKLNRSDYIPYTLAVMADARGDTPEHIAEITYNNALDVFRLK